MHNDVYKKQLCTSQEVRSQGVKSLHKTKWEAFGRGAFAHPAPVVVTALPCIYWACVALFLTAAFPRIIRSFLEPTAPGLGQRLAIECHIDGVPPPSVSWTKDNVTVSGNDRISISLSNTGVARLQIGKTTSSDNGLYACTAESDAGSVLRAFRIDLGGEYWIEMLTTQPLFRITGELVWHPTRLYSKYLLLAALQSWSYFHYTHFPVVSMATTISLSYKLGRKKGGPNWQIKSAKNYHAAKVGVKYRNGIALIVTQSPSLGVTVAILHACMEMPS